MAPDYRPEELLPNNFPFKPTQGQQALFAKLSPFLLQRMHRQTFLLKGFAGTGKTSVVSTLVKVARYFNYKSMLMAPTGRAAKVMALYAGRKAFTIHKIIFKQVENTSTGKLHFARQKNYNKNTIFIVDEASMINNSRGEYGSSGLLYDLVNYIFEEEDSGNKLVLVGDTAQLPPVGQSASPALDVLYLEKEFKLQVTAHLLTDVVRQEQESGILLNATRLREQITRNKFSINFRTAGFNDIYKMAGNKLEDGMRYAYNKFGEENTCIVTRSNKSATLYNQFVRRQIKFCEAEIEAGDLVMIVKNNYHWLAATSQAGFLANGEFAEIRRIANEEEIHGFRFADLTLQLIDYPEEPAFVAKAHLGTLYSSAPSLTAQENRQLYDALSGEYRQVAENEKDLYKMLREDPYLNALQIKFAYALTCHKAQGGQWQAVFVDLGYVREDMLDTEFMRWLYTAITRSASELYLMNFPPDFFEQ